MEYEVNGLPLHVLLVHFIVVGVPLAALLTVLSALWPAARRRLGIITPLVALGRADHDAGRRRGRGMAGRRGCIPRR